MSIPSVATRRSASIEMARFRSDLRARPPRPFEVLAGGDRWSPDVEKTAESTIRRGWRDRGFPRVVLAPPIAWDALCAEHRTWFFHLHCWEPLSPVLSAYDNTSESVYLSFAADVALDWARAYPSLDTDSPFAWYDMAIGLRAYRLGYLVDAAARSESFEDDVVAELMECALLHAEALADDARFAPHSNHGFYFAAGQLALARRLPLLPGMPEARRQGEARLRRLVGTQFTEEGVHREHSPDYHRMVLETFLGLLEADLLEGEELRRMSDEIQEALAWFVLPNGRIAMLGDSPDRMMVRKNFDLVQNDALRFVLSGGKAGEPPAEPFRAFPESGYVVFRDGWPRGHDDFRDWSYLVQTCAFHSRAHKHADDLSFIWYDRGRELLVDSGRFGYLDPADSESQLWREGFWYANPNRIYVESTTAHNTVEIDGRSYARTRTKPYGSALERYGEWAGICYSEAHVVHWGSIEHARVLLFRPGEWLVVFDRLRDSHAHPHRFVQRFHFAPDLDIRSRDGLLEITPTPVGERLWMAPLLPAEPVMPVRGQEEPRLGWISRQEGEMTPCWTAGYAAEDRSCTFATLFAFGEEPPIPDHENAAVSTFGRSARLGWSHGAWVHRLSFARPARRPFTLDYRLASE